MNKKETTGTENKKSFSSNTHEQKNNGVIPEFSVEYKRDISEECAEYLKTEELCDESKQYMDPKPSLVEQDIEERKEHFKKLNLPEEEMLKTEANTNDFPNQNEPIENNIKIDPVVVGDTLKTTGKGVMSSAKSLFAKAKEYRERKRQERLEKQQLEKDKYKEETKSHSEITHIKDVIKKEKNLKTIEEIKNPELAPYPIREPKTVEVIQSENKENVEEEMKEIKKIIEPEVQVPKDIPQQKEDPYIAAAANDDKKKKPKKESWIHKQSSHLWNKTKSGSKTVYHKVKDSEIASKVLIAGSSAILIVLAIAKRKSFKTYRCIEDLKRSMKSPCQVHAAIQCIRDESNIMNIIQIPFPKYLMKTSVAAAVLNQIDNAMPLALLAVNSNDKQKEILDSVVQANESVLAKVKVLYYPSDINSELPDNVLYGDLMIKGIGMNQFTRSHYHSLTQYLVRMGYCSIDRDINIDVNEQTKKYMKKLSNNELYAIRRKLGMWEERTSSYEDNFLVRTWFAMYRPLYKHYILPREKLIIKNQNE